VQRRGRPPPQRRGPLRAARGTAGVRGRDPRAALAKLLHMKVVPTSVRTVIVLLMLALPSTASAASVEIFRSGGTHFAGPALAGDNVVVTSSPPNHTIDILSTAAGNLVKRPLHVTTPNSSPVFSASGDTILARVNNESGASDLYRGPLAGPLTKLQSCGPD